MNIPRILKHLATPHWFALRVLTRPDLAIIGAAVSASEALHRGELRFIVEGPLPLAALWPAQSPRERAVDLFAQQRVWDTEENSGILIYVQLVDRDVEIIADRGIAACVPQAQWDDICRAMETAFANGQWRQGAEQAVVSAGKLLALHFPARADNPNELPDAPLVI